MHIQYATGDARQPNGQGPKIIVHVCNDAGRWGKGFVLARSKRWKKPEEAYRDWHAHPNDQPFQLGQVQFVIVEPDLWAANLIGQHGVQRKGALGIPPIRYEAVEQGLSRVATFANWQFASVHMPRIGCGLAGGKWEEIEPIVQRTLLEAGVAVTVYDLG